MMGDTLPGIECEFFCESIACSPRRVPRLNLKVVERHGAAVAVLEKRPGDHVSLTITGEILLATARMTRISGARFPGSPRRSCARLMPWSQA
jgi:hypothetical protein